MWILHPQGGLKPVAEGIAIGREFSDWKAESEECVDILRMLSNEGVQMVQVRKVHRKNVPVMFLTGNDSVKFLDDAVCFSDPPTIALKWTARHLVEIDNNSKKPRTSQFIIIDLVHEFDVVG